MDPQRRVSVIVPCFNGEKYLGDALASILAQTYRPFEIIVIDDGSTDASAVLARAFPEVHYVYQAHAGLGAALNHGVQLAAGDYFAFLDADDVWLENKLAKQLACFEKDAALEVVFSHLVHFSDDPARDTRHVIEGYFKGTMLIRRDAFFRVGSFDPQWRVGDFIDWYIRAREKNIKSVMLPDILLKRRIHDDNMSTRERDHRTAYLRILKQSLDRRQNEIS